MTPALVPPRRTADRSVRPSLPTSVHLSRCRRHTRHAQPGHGRAGRSTQGCWPRGVSRGMRWGECCDGGFDAPPLSKSGCPLPSGSLSGGLPAGFLTKRLHRHGTELAVRSPGEGRGAAGRSLLCRKCSCDPCSRSTECDRGCEAGPESSPGCAAAC